LHAYADLARGRERVVLTYGDAAVNPVLLRFQREALLERLPGRARGPEQQRWAATVAAFVAHGAGIAVLLADESCASVLGDGPPSDVPDSAGVALARHHLGGRRVIPLLDECASTDDAWTRALGDAGVALGAPRGLDLTAFQVPDLATPRARALD
jgi:hypothetical protein